MSCVLIDGEACEAMEPATIRLDIERGQERETDCTRCAGGHESETGSAGGRARGVCRLWLVRATAHARRYARPARPRFEIL